MGKREKRGAVEEGESGGGEGRGSGWGETEGETEERGAEERGGHSHRGER